MNKFKGTQGKWLIDETMGIIVTADPITDNVICMMPDEVCVQSRGNWDDNARLISKAPEMLEMLNEVLTSEYVTGRVLKEQIKKLIKKATGE